jgi:glycosyltransferase involved in cell wall biosynthesis
MRILVPDAQSFHGGVETVTTKIIQAWTNYPKVKITWVLPPHRSGKFRTKFRGNPTVDFESFQWSRTHPRSLLLSLLKRTRSALANAWEFKCNEAKLRKIARKRNCSHCFYFWPIKEPVPNLNIPVFCLICDLAWQHVPESYPDDDPNDLDDAIREWVSRSRKVFTISNHTRSEVLGMLPKMSKKIQTVLLAASNQQVANTQALPLDESLPFFLYPSAPNPQKNHLVLFQAVSELLDRGLKFRLVLTGANTKQLLGETPMTRQLPEQARRLYQERKDQLVDTIVAADQVPENALADLFRKCIAVLMPSQYEGFGLAVAEAFAHGKPVIASDLPVFHEQIDCYHAHEFIETFPAANHESLADLMESRLQEGAISAERSQQLRNKTDQWTWDDVARTYIKVMKETDVREVVA